jgi:hypothetical protein
MTTDDEKVAQVENALREAGVADSDIFKLGIQSLLLLHAQDYYDKDFVKAASKEGLLAAKLTAGKVDFLIDRLNRELTLVKFGPSMPARLVCTRRPCQSFDQSYEIFKTRNE